MKPLRVVIVGCGSIFPMHAASLRTLKHVEIAAVCDIKEERAVRCARECSCTSYLDYREMIEEERPDVVHICTPHYLHPIMAIYALSHGCNVLTEKPMAFSVDDAKEMIATAERNGRTLGVIFQNRYNAGSQLIKKTIDSGELGKVLGGRASVWWHRDNAYYHNSGWRGTLEMEGGGVVVNQAVHTLDLMCWFAGQKATKVNASIATRRLDIEVEDSAEGLIHFDGNIDCCFQFTNCNSYDAPVEIEMHCEKGKARLIGDRATIVFDDGRELTAANDPNETIEYGEMKNYWGVSHVKQISDFYRSLEEGKSPYIDGNAALPTTKVMCAILQSGRTGRSITID